VDKEILLKNIDLVTERLLNLGGSDLSKDRRADGSVWNTGMVQRDFGIEAWDWPQGVGLYGLVKLEEHFGDDRYDKFLDRWYQKNMAEGLPSRNINTTAPYLALLSLYRKNRNRVYETMIKERAEWLVKELPKTEEGGFQHVTTAIGNSSGVILNDGQLWADTLFMAVLFLNQAGQEFDNSTWTDESVHQFLVHIKYLYDKKTGLIHHGWNFHDRSNFGNVFWCRGNSWFTYGVTDYLSSFKTELNPGIRNYLIETLRSQVKALAGLQSENGLYHTVLDDPASYPETSGSAAITAGILKGIKLGVLDERYQETAERGLEGICSMIDPDGTVKNVSAGTAIGMNADHYRNISIRPMAYGQSLVLLALVEAVTG
jgi:unsaturated rhamnogalacturonyl hydrolase